MKYLFLFFTISALFSCTEEDLKIDKKEELGLSEPKVIFQSSQEFYETYTSLLNKPYEDLLEWSNEKGINSALMNINLCNDKEMCYMPRAFQALFNKNLEIQIQDSILQYQQGDLYITCINKIQLDSPVWYGSAVCDSISDEDPITTRMHYDVTFDHKAKSRQHEFRDANISSYHYKYVHQLKSTTVRLAGVSGVYRTLILDLKLEYRKTGGWKVAGRPRDIVLNFNYSAKTNSYNQSGPVQRTLNGVEKNYEFSLASWLQPLGVTPQSMIWDVNLNGTITQTMTGYPNTKWIDSYN